MTHSKLHARLAKPLIAVAPMALAATWLLAQPSPAQPGAPATQPAAAAQGQKTVTPSGLTIVHVEPSRGAQPGDLVYVLYSGKLANGGAVFDSSAQHNNEPIPVKLGTGQVIKGWEEGLLGAQVGEKRKLIIPPNLGYAEKGRGDKIPPNATLEFDLEVVGIIRSTVQ